MPSAAAAWEGGDAGSFIAPQLGPHRHRACAWCSSADRSPFPPGMTTHPVTAQAIGRSWRRLKAWSSMETSGYAGIHATRPRRPSPKQSPTHPRACWRGIAGRGEHLQGIPLRPRPPTRLHLDRPRHAAHQHDRSTGSPTPPARPCGCTKNPRSGARSSPSSRSPSPAHRGLPRQQHDPRRRREAEHRGALVGVRPRRPLRADGSPRPRMIGDLLRILPQAPLIQEPQEPMGRRRGRCARRAPRLLSRTGRTLRTIYVAARRADDDSAPPMWPDLRRRSRRPTGYGSHAVQAAFLRRRELESSRCLEMPTRSPLAGWAAAQCGGSPIASTAVTRSDSGPDKSLLADQDNLVIDVAEGVAATSPPPGTAR